MRGLVFFGAALVLSPSCSLFAPLQPCESDADCEVGTCRELRCDATGVVADDDAGTVRGDDAGFVDAGTDGGQVDTDPADAGPVDAGEDPGADDSGPPNGRGDGGSMDVDATDAGAADAGPVDAGPIDAGPIDAGPIDAGPMDAGYDAGYDAGCLDCAFCAGSTWSHPSSADFCERTDYSGGGSACEPPDSTCPTCMTTITKLDPPTICDGLRVGTCQGTTPPGWDPLDQVGCGTGCLCVNGAPTETICIEGSGDEDGDLLADCADEADCAGEPCDNTTKTCQPSVLAGGDLVCLPPENCLLNTGDENLNGASDCADSACQGESCGSGCLCSGFAPTEQNCWLTSGDEDGDGKLNCEDPDCYNGGSCGGGCSCSGGEPHETVCYGGDDNDGDGDADCADVEDCPENTKCTSAIGTTAKCVSGACKDLVCDGWYDNDQDGLCDCKDPDCGAPDDGCVCDNGSLPSSIETDCGDGNDNDFDDDIDCDDADCSAACP